MSVLFEPIEIHGMPLKNRFVRSATHDGCSSEQGKITDKTIELYAGLARGGVGLIVTGFACVHRTGAAFLHQTLIDSDDSVAGLKRLVDSVHKYDVKIAVQLVHCGRNAYAVRKSGQTPLAPSLIQNDPSYGEAYRAMTEAEIEGTIGAFGQAAKRARAAGFDAIQLHAAHSYLFSQFLSPRSNQRTDRWGGSLENRMRFHMEVIKVIRQAVGQDYPLLIKLGVKDTAAGGLTLREGCQVAYELSINGIDGIEVSEGLEETRANHMRKGIKPGKSEAYYARWAREIKREVRIPVMLVGGMRSPHIGERIVEAGGADMISMCRPFIREPDIINRWHRGEREPALCISCNLCVERLRREEPLECVQESRKRAQMRLTNPVS